MRTYKSPTRRDFLRRSACTGMGLTGVVNTLAHLRLTGAALAADPPGEAGYKALVCLYQGGGIDSNNILVPRTGTARNDYSAARGVLKLDTADLHNIAPATNT
ncbi:MAG: hypothetical protein P8J87_13520, partial [Verrucomicrobiales bacterium]|nr:hypothetical protein [Verrucomicrobiales bacterium]